MHEKAIKVNYCLLNVINKQSTFFEDNYFRL